ncbi:MAG: SpoIIE family protein phosphatase [Treponema sp.]|nr:SpoIIE family protein phosphatase [Treponema sp.]
MGTIKRTLNKSVLSAVVFFTLLLSACLGIIGYRTYYSGVIQQYQKYERDVLTLAVNDFDWDSIDECIKNGSEDDSFQKLRERLDYIKTNTNIDWLYMVEPLNTEENDNMKYICTGNTPENYAGYKASGEDFVRLGKLSGSEYPPDVAGKYLDFFKNSKPGDFWYYPNKTEWGYAYTTSIVVRNSSGKALGVMSVDIYMHEIETAMRVYPTTVFFATLILAGLFVLLLTRWMNRRVINPLKSLQVSASDFVARANGEDVDSLNFDAPKINTQDEIQALSDSLIEMTMDTKKYMTKLLVETKEREKISADLNAAAQIQDGMLPHIFPGIPDRTDFELFASMNPAKDVGGDFYDFFFIDKDHLALVIADVSGKGIPAALFMVISKTIIKNRASIGDSLSPAQILHDANNQLCEGNASGLFVTVWLGIIDLNTGLIKAANAGHEYPAIRQPGKKFELLKDSHGFVLAGLEGSKYKEYEIQLEPGATIFVYTDGVPEATNANNELFELDRLEKALNINPEAKPKDLLPIIRREVDRFVGDAPQFDDLTMLSLTYYGRK